MFTWLITVLVTVESDSVKSARKAKDSDVGVKIKFCLSQQQQPLFLKKA